MITVLYIFSPQNFKATIHWNRIFWSCIGGENETNIEFSRTPYFFFKNRNSFWRKVCIDCLEVWEYHNDFSLHKTIQIHTKVQALWNTEDIKFLNGCNIFLSPRKSDQSSKLLNLWPYVKILFLLLFFMPLSYISVISYKHKNSYIDLSDERLTMTRVLSKGWAAEKAGDITST